MRSLERFTSPEEEYAARVGTILRFGETAVYTRPHYSVVTDEVDDSLVLTNFDGLHECDASRLAEAERQIHNALGAVTGRYNVSSLPPHINYEATLVGRVYRDWRIPNRAYTLHMLNMSMGGRHRATVKRFIFQSSDHYTITETKITKTGGGIAADRVLYPQPDELTEALDMHFTGKTDNRSRFTHVQARAALIGNQTAARYLNERMEMTPTEPHLKSLLRRVIDRCAVVGVRNETYLSPGPPSEAELDRITQLLFRAANSPLG